MARHEDISLSAEHLAIGYREKKGHTTVGQGIQFRGASGEVIGIVGVNGIGKSTLLRTLAGLLPTLSGLVRVNGESVDMIPAAKLSRLVSVVLTDPIATKNLSVGELITLGRQPYTNWLGSLSPEDIQQIDEVVHRLNLNDLLHKKCYELSDGQFQRVLIGRALAQDTPIMLLDEPTMHLDLFHKVQLLKLLRDIAKSMNKIVVFTSHELNLVIQLCSKILILGPETHAFGSPKELIESNQFRSLFPDGEVTFDAASGSFKIASL